MPSLRQVMDQRQSLRQEQIMAPQQIQSLEILMAPIQELEQKISEEMIENPTLEMLEMGTERLVGNPVEDEGGSESEAYGDDSVTDKNETLDNLLKLDQIWEDRMSAPSHSRRSYSSEDEEQRQHCFDSLVSEQSLQDYLMEQLRQTEALDDEMQRVCEEIIGSIDDSGYLRSHLADIATACQATDIAKVKQALDIIKSFDPPGIGAADLRECLLLQLKRSGREKTLEYQVVDKHLEDVGRNRLREITRKLNTSMSELRESLERIKKLYPHPGSLVMPTPNTNFVLPEVYVFKNEHGEWQVQSNNDRLPRLRISPYYLKLLKEEGTSNQVKSYIRQKIADSKLLLRALTQRESTIVRIARNLLEKQRGFFEGGVSNMKPLTMSEVAADLEVHETTVSRAIANKYMMTPHGLFPFRHFFSTGYTTGGGEEVSSHVVKQKLRELVNSEDKRKPLSDNKLAEMLKQEGFDVARRTVAKYREELDIMSSNMRRSYA
ncbi:MAG: RNA polymerase factor sigma-54 [Lentisphaeria bacterium]